MPEVRGTIGTSAGSTVAAQITGDAPLAVLYDRQLAASSSELEVELDLTELASRLGAAAAARPAVPPVAPRRRTRAPAHAAAAPPTRAQDPA